MPFELQYKLGPGSYLAHRRLADRARLKSYRNGFLSWCGLVAGTAVLGLVAAVMARSLVLSVVFVAILIAIAWEAAGYRRRYEATVAEAAARVPTRDVSLRIDDVGFHESVAGVESFAPWSAVASYALSADSVSVELASGAWCLIPRAAFGASTDSSLESLVLLLQQHAIRLRQM